MYVDFLFKLMCCSRFIFIFYAFAIINLFMLRESFLSHKVTVQKIIVRIGWLIAKKMKSVGWLYNHTHTCNVNNLFFILSVLFSGTINNLDDNNTDKDLMKSHAHVQTTSPLINFNFKALDRNLC